MKMTSRIKSPPDSCSDELAIQTLKCTKRSFLGLGIMAKPEEAALI